jgi:hypothetical protein
VKIKAWLIIWGEKVFDWGKISHKGMPKTDTNWHYPQQGVEQLNILTTRKEARKYNKSAKQFKLTKAVPCVITYKTNHTRG